MQVTGKSLKKLPPCVYSEANIIIWFSKRKCFFYIIVGILTLAFKCEIGSSGKNAVRSVNIRCSFIACHSQAVHSQAQQHLVLLYNGNLVLYTTLKLLFVCMFTFINMYERGKSLRIEIAVMLTRQYRWGFSPHVCSFPHCQGSVLVFTLTCGSMNHSLSYYLS